MSPSLTFLYVLVYIRLGQVRVCARSERSVKEILSIPDEIRVVELMPLGYPQNPSSTRKDRYPLNEIVKYDAW